MARLVGRSEGFRDRVIELHLGLNRFGRSPDNDFHIDHPSVSAWHCELYLGAQEILVCDCESTNGTFLNGEPIQKSALQQGQTLSLGDVELFVDSIEIRVAIPKLEIPRPAPPVVLEDGSLLCHRHPKAKVTHQCTHCREVLCDKCVHRLRRRGGKLLKLCPLCSHSCAPLGTEGKKKKSFLGFLQKTVRLPLISKSKEE
jgi:pSer/pThr/pTyr-binding forkhead associated (FHA) protein